VTLLPKARARFARSRRFAVSFFNSRPGPLRAADLRVRPVPGSLFPSSRVGRPEIYPPPEVPPSLFTEFWLDSLRFSGVSGPMAS
jgi:hypothetical protein